MGNTAQSTANSQSILQKYTFTKQISESKNLYKNTQQSNKQYITVQRTFATHQMLLQYQKRLKPILSINHPYFQNQSQHVIVTNSNICSIQYRVIHFFQYQPHTLQQQLQTRKTHQRHFQQKEVWSILCSCVLAMSYLTKNNIPYYVLHPRDIVIDKLGMIKIVSPLLSQSNSTCQQIINDTFYYSPEHLKAFKGNNFTGLTNKSSTFTLGLTLLHILSLQPMNQLYDYKDCSINIELLNQLVSKISQQQIQDIIKKMLKLHAYDRITFTELEQMLYNILQQGEEGVQRQDYSTHAYSNSRRNDDGNFNNTVANKMPQNDNKVHQVDNNGNSQIQRLQESIYKVKKTQVEQINDVIVNNSFMKKSSKQSHQSYPDTQDTPSNMHSIHQSIIDHENVDQQDSASFTPNETSQLQSYRQNNESQLQKQNYTIKNKENTNINNIALKQRSFNNFSNIIQHPSHQQNDKQKSLRSSFNASINNRNHGHEDNKPYHIREELSRGVYEGYKVGKMRHGYGVFYYSQGGKYAGEWVKNKMEGRGALYYANGQIAYQGQWKNDKLNGYGILYNQTPQYFVQNIDFKSLHLINDDSKWTKYQGNFVQDQKNGEGTLFFGNGEYYRGYFKQDLPHGNGIFKCINGNLVKGSWILGVMQVE